MSQKVIVIQCILALLACKVGLQIGWLLAGWLRRESCFFLVLRAKSLVLRFGVLLPAGSVLFPFQECNVRSACQATRRRPSPGPFINPASVNVLPACKRSPGLWVQQLRHFFFETLFLFAPMNPGSRLYLCHEQHNVSQCFGV